MVCGRSNLELWCAQDHDEIEEHDTTTVPDQSSDDNCSLGHMKHGVMKLAFAGFRVCPQAGTSDDVPPAAAHPTVPNAPLLAEK
eukprot:743043-Amphidinium_carterae.1